MIVSPEFAKLIQSWMASESGSRVVRIRSAGIDVDGGRSSFLQGDRHAADIFRAVPSIGDAEVGPVVAVGEVDIIQSEHFC